MAWKREYRFHLPGTCDPKIGGTMTTAQAKTEKPLTTGHTQAIDSLNLGDGEKMCFVCPLRLHPLSIPILRKCRTRTLKVAATTNPAMRLSRKDISISISPFVAPHDREIEMCSRGLDRITPRSIHLARHGDVRHRGTDTALAAATHLCGMRHHWLLFSASVNASG